ncbi:MULTISPECIES: SRPBCC family protein [unclassified Streptomyces]|uniref:SRPBCC family protein n=1 Tax=unclassified Streptomyces TaxID=2593676 RepID=UPI0006F41B65|nr:MULTISPECIES: SRPBCC family protein [unclassified Streptomyces]KQX49771.1 polyketide cyclase [Streptomyces sp. Root1304]KRA80184.1 polyketide cyclase [Streptomyces sp. Root66D1]
MARRLTPVELDFTASAPVRLAFTAALAAPPPAVYRSIAVETGSLPSWFTAVTSAVPTGDGAGRTVRLRGGIVFEETILAAEPDVRYAYRVDSANAPGVTALAEEWTLSPDGRGTRLRWTMAADGPAAFRFAMRLAGPGVGMSFRDATRRLDRRLTPARPPSPGSVR